MTAPPSTCSRAFSLSEALLSLALVSIVLGLFAAILNNLTRHSRMQAAQDEVFAAALVALSQIESEARNADPWISPPITSGAAVTFLEFEVPDYEQNAIRLPSPPSQIPLPLWESRQLSRRLRFQVSGQDLLREVVGQPGNLTLAHSISGMSIQRQQQQLMVIQLSLQMPNGRLRQLQSTFQLPLQRGWGP